MPPVQPQLGRLTDAVLVGTTGVAVSGATYEVRRQGATIDGAQSGTSPLAVSVNDTGAIKAGDTVAIDTGSTTYSVDAVNQSALTITLSGFGGTLNLSNNSRITPTNNLPTLYIDGAGGETTPNPTSTSAQGEVAVWASGGYYDVKKSGATITTELDIDKYVDQPFHVFANNARWGIAMDGTTDDKTALQNLVDTYALDTSGNGTKGVIIHLQKGEYGLASQLTLPTQISFEGEGEGNTVLKALAGFSFNGTTDAVVRLGEAGVAADATQLWRLTVDCNEVANSIGVYSTSINDDSGLYHVDVKNFKVKGVYITSAAAERITLEHVALLHKSTTAISLHIDTVNYVTLKDLAVKWVDGVTQSTVAGIKLGAGKYDLNRIYIAGHDIGVEANVGAYGSARSVWGHASVTDTVKLLQEGWSLYDIDGQVNDTTTGGAGTFTMAPGDLYIHENGSSPNETIFSNIPSIKNRINADWKWRASMIGKDRTSVASASALDATTTTGNYWYITGTTAITSITTASADNGRVLVLEFASTAQVTDGSNLNLKGSFAPIAGDMLVLIGDGTNWNEISRTAPTASSMYTARETVASASTITISTGKMFINLTGTTNITLIQNASDYAGRFIVVTSAGDLTIAGNGTSATPNSVISNDSTAISLGAALSPDSVTLTSDGVNWVQTSPRGFGS